MLHHLPEGLRSQAMGEMFRVLRPGGSVLVADFRPPPSRVGRHLVTALTGHHAMAGNRVDLLEPMVRAAGFEQLRAGDLRPWIHYEGGPLVVVERGDELVEGDVLGRVSNGGGRSGGGCCGRAGRGVAVGG